MIKPPEANSKLKLRFSVDKGKSLRLVENVIWTWEDLVERLSKSYTDKLTLAQFKDLSKDAQAKRKSSNGYFIGGQMRKGVRHNTNLMEKNLLTFDIDQATPELLKDLRNGTSGLGMVEYVVYSTHTHGGDTIKLRVVIPLGKLLPKDMFQAIARVCAWNLDFNMAMVDTVSFIPGQIMYWPAHCRDVEPIFIHRKGPLLDVMRTLEEWGGGDRWKDISLLPLSPRERGLRENSGTRAQSPLEKRGIVGAFCRRYTVADGVETFLSDIYEASEVGPDGIPTRYSYIPGTSSNGVQVYDDGHLQSWHGSDPISGLNVNIFDAVRIHRYGHLDTHGEKEIEDPRQFKSYKAMEQWLQEDADVMTELRDSNYGLSDEDADEAFEADETAEVTSEDEIPDSVFEVPDDLVDEDWRERLDTNEKGTIKSTLPNIVLILTNASPFKGKLAFNAFTNWDCLIGTIRSKSLRVDVRVPPGGEVMIGDKEIAAIRQILEAPRGAKRTGWSLKVTKRDLDDAVSIVCMNNTVHPIKNHLGVLHAQNGVTLIDQMFIKGLGTPDTPYYRQTSRLLLTAAVARVFEPGCKFDFMPVLIGPQGIRKSTFVMQLGYVKWAGETEGHFDDKKKFVEASMGFWFLENGEMTHFRRASDDDAIKAMLSGTVDTVRLSYRRNPERIARQFVMVGTTNARNFLRDRHRRIWPIVCGEGQVDIEWLIANRDQLFAEAVAEYRRMRRESNSGFLPLYLTGEALAEFEQRQDDAMLPNDAEATAGILREFLDAWVPPNQAQPGWTQEDEFDDSVGDDEPVQRTYTCALELFVRGLGNDPAKYDRRAAQAFGEVLRHLSPEWETSTARRCGKWGLQRTLIRVGKPPDEDL